MQKVYMESACEGAQLEFRVSVPWVLLAESEEWIVILPPVDAAAKVLRMG